MNREFKIEVRFRKPGILAALVLSGAILATTANSQSNGARLGLVSDAATAARIAEAVLSLLFGDEEIKRRLPFEITLVDKTWRVVARLPRPSDPQQVRAGGDITLEIDSFDSRISKLWYER